MMLSHQRPVTGACVMTQRRVEADLVQPACVRVRVSQSQSPAIGFSESTRISRSARTPVTATRRPS